MILFKEEVGAIQILLVNYLHNLDLIASVTQSKTCILSLILFHFYN